MSNATGPATLGTPATVTLSAIDADLPAVLQSDGRQAKVKIVFLTVGP